MNSVQVKPFIAVLVALLWCSCPCGSLHAQGAVGTPHARAEEDASAAQSAGTVYIVQKGDCLGKILREVYHVPDEIIFSTRTQAILQQANPHLFGLNDLRAGEKLIIPDQLIGQGQNSTSVGSQALHGHSDHRADTSRSLSSGSKTAPVSTAPDPSDAADTLQPEPDDSPIRENTISAVGSSQHEAAARKLAAAFAAAFGGSDDTTCLKKIDLDNAGSFSLDCSRFPVYELPWHKTIILDYGNRLPDSLKKFIAAAWSQTSVVSVSEGDSQKLLLEKIIDGCGLEKMDSGNRYTISRNAVDVSLNSDWIVFKKNEPKTIYAITCGTLSGLPDLLTRCLAGMGVTLLAISGNVADDCPQAEYPVASLTPDNLTDPVAMTDLVLQTAGITFQKNAKTKLSPRTESGISLEVSADRKFKLAGKTYFIVFKHLSDNIASLFQRQGYRLLQIDPKQKTSTDMLQEVLLFCNVPHTDTMVNFQYAITATTSVTFSLPGMLVQTKSGELLLTKTKLDKDMLNIINLLIKKIIYF